MTFPTLRPVLAVLLALALLAPAGAAAQSTVVPWGGPGLPQVAVQYRDDHTISPRRNIAVFEFYWPGEQRPSTIAIDSEPYSPKATRGNRIEGHSERRIANILSSYGIQKEWVTGIYSELRPCSQRGRHCANLVGEYKNARVVSHSFEYDGPGENKRRGTKALSQAVRSHNAALRAAQQQLKVPGAAPPRGPLTNALATPVPRPGGIDLSTLELRYVSDAGPRGGISYAMRGLPSTGLSDPAAGMAAARAASDSFFTWLALPPQSFWVNLNPDQPDKIIDPQFARTDAGHVLLAADFELKHLLGPLSDPNRAPTGAEFWRQIDALYGGDALKSNFCLQYRIWIEPAPATVRETAGELHILDAPLKVSMEQVPPLATQPGGAYPCPAECPQLLAAKADVFRHVMLPPMTAAVNTGPQFAPLRRVYLSRVAAEWVRTRLDRRAKLGRIVDSGQVGRWAAQLPWNPMDIWNRYRHAYLNPDYTYVRKIERPEGTWTMTYVWGGIDFSRTPRRQVSKAEFRAAHPGLAKRAKRATHRTVTDASGLVWLGAGKAKPAQKRLKLEARRWLRPR